MRDIKFRGKRINNGEWIKGYYVHYCFANHDKHFIYTTNGFMAEVHPDTVGQFTPLKDNKGQEVWIGDKVKTKVGPIWYEREVVQAESGAYCVKLPVTGSTGEGLIMLIGSDFEVTGTIHDQKGD